MESLRAAAAGLIWMGTAVASAPAGTTSSTRPCESEAVPPAGPMVVIFGSRPTRRTLPRSMGSPGCA